MADLASHIATDNVELFHLDREIFSAPALEGTVSLLHSPLISVARLFVVSETKNAFSSKFNEMKGILEDFVSPRQVRDAWRVDNESDIREKFVVFCGWDSLETHF